MVDASRDFKMLAGLVRRRGVDWVLEQATQVEHSPQPKPGPKPHYLYNLASIWACVEVRRRQPTRKVEVALDELHEDMQVSTTGPKFSFSMLRARYYEAQNHHKHGKKEPTDLTRLMESTLGDAKATLKDIKRIASKYVIMPTLVSPRMKPSSNDAADTVLSGIDTLGYAHVTFVGRAQYAPDGHLQASGVVILYNLREGAVAPPEDLTPKSVR